MCKKCYQWKITQVTFWNIHTYKYIRLLALKPAFQQGSCYQLPLSGEWKSKSRIIKYAHIYSQVFAGIFWSKDQILSSQSYDD